MARQHNMSPLLPIIVGQRGFCGRYLNHAQQHSFLLLLEGLQAHLVLAQLLDPGLHLLVQGLQALLHQVITSHAGHHQMLLGALRKLLPSLTQPPVQTTVGCQEVWRTVCSALWLTRRCEGFFLSGLPQSSASGKVAPRFAISSASCSLAFAVAVAC